MQLCPETIYRALLVPGGQGLHKRYCAKLRTDRRIRKSRWLTRSGHGAAVRNMKMIDQRPPEVETKQQAGHWEGDRATWKVARGEWLYRLEVRVLKV